MSPSFHALLASVALATSVGCGSTQASTVSPDAAQDAASAAVQPSTAKSPVYFTFVIHDERTKERFERFRGSESGYTLYRNTLLRIAQLLTTYGAKLSYQADYLVLDGVEKYEAALLAQNPSLTNGKPLFKHLTEDLGFSLEAHAHECIPNRGNPSLCTDKAYNYADVVARIKQVTSITPPGIVGGTTSGERSLDEWKSCIAGNVFAEKWCPEAITVFSGESGGHGPGGDDYHSGVWRPTSLTEGFLTDDPNGKVAYIGSGYLFSAALGASKVTMEPVDGIRKLASMVDSGAIRAGQIVTASAIMAIDKFVDEDHWAGLEAILTEVKALVDSGTVQTSTYPEVLQQWRTTHGSQPSVIPY